MTLRLTRDERTAMGERLRAARDVSGLSLRQIADATGVSFTTVPEWEHGSLPRPDIRARLADLYDVDEDILFAEYESRVAAAKALIGR